MEMNKGKSVLDFVPAYLGDMEGYSGRLPLKFALNIA
jgi:hypothetical protein